ncbi:MAG TPA: class I SAM-dependent methyltransferase [Rhizomicrobium sp.]|jgi:SAM-dependent methyltransferase|nr:class I SAM-dependent methyltransferase [Rhizomicrobium sp.]
MNLNQAQIDYWNGAQGERWAKYQAVMDRTLADSAEAALTLADARSGENALDIGCGSGSTSLLLVKAVGSAGAVTGVDVSQPMLRLARGRTAAKNIRFIEADAATYSFEAEFDLIFSRFGVMFFVDPIAAFANIRQAGRGSARLAFICWRAVTENEWASLPFQIAKPFLSQQPAIDPNAPGPFAFADSNRLREILESAGFSAIRIEPFQGFMNLGHTPDGAAFQSTNLMGPTSRALRDVDEATRARVMAAIASELARLQTAGQEIRLRTACWLVSARA